MSAIDYELANDKEYSKVAYIQVLCFAVSAAKGVGYTSRSVNNDGFKLHDIREWMNKNCCNNPKIRDDWLISCLLDICTVRSGSS
ncbi:MAG: hypothetical protein H6939_05210 [Burkholderiales bacterium]|nr:hypothetical protein [Burkholderiales bacterium]